MCTLRYTRRVRLCLFFKPRQGILLIYQSGLERGHTQLDFEFLLCLTIHKGKNKKEQLLGFESTSLGWSYADLTD